jgi:predicted AAA+ superfamily ATPase
MDFEEFLLANGEDKLIEIYKKNPNQIFDGRLYEYMKQYLFVGGMPEVLQSWITEQNIQKVELLQ